MMEWPRLLAARRLGKTKVDEPDRSRSPFQQDFDRIIFSTAFRRLQDKTQVFPLADNDFVHTRLTHSLETSCVGRSLGTAVGHALEKAGRDLAGLPPSDMGAIVAAACISHDIGNPPFGHSGEDAIRHWFDALPEKDGIRQLLSPAEQADISKYEGNAQGFRLLARLQMATNRGGLQLTCATLGAFTKYPAPSPSLGKLPWSKKFGYFQSEAGLFDEVASHLGLLPRDGGWSRHPLAFLVEAADDICYRLVDFEDGFRLGCVSFQEVSDRLIGVIGDPEIRSYLEKMGDEKNQIEFLRARAIHAAIDQVRDRFVALEKEILEGTLDKSLIEGIPAARELKEIQRVSFAKVYAARQVIEIEAAGFEVLGGLLDVFAKAALSTAPNDRDKKMLQLVPGQFLARAEGPYVQLLQILDFVSGMTDSYAVSLYKKIKGISLPGR